MRSPIKSILAVFALALIAAAPLARAQDSGNPPPAGGGDDQQPPPPPHHRRGPSAEELKAKLKLTDDQFAKVSAILSSTKDQMTAIRDDDSLSDDDRRDKMMDLMKSTHDQIKALLTPAQQTIYDSMMPHHGGGGGGGGGGPPPDSPPPPPSGQ